MGNHLNVAKSTSKNPNEIKIADRRYSLLTIKITSFPDNNKEAHASLQACRLLHQYSSKNNYITWKEFGRGENPLLDLSTFTEKFLCRHGKLQSVLDDLTGLQCISAHHQRLHGPRVLLLKALTDFLKGHCVQPLRV